MNLVKNEIVLRNQGQIKETREKPQNLEWQVIAKLCKLPSNDIDVWSSSSWGTIGMKHLRLENDGHRFKVILLGTESRLEITVKETHPEGRRRKWFRNLGLTMGGIVVDNTTLPNVGVKEVDSQGVERRLNTQEKERFFQELIGASVVSELEPKTEKIVYRRGMELKRIGS